MLDDAQKATLLTYWGSDPQWLTELFCSVRCYEDLFEKTVYVVFSKHGPEFMVIIDEGDYIVFDPVSMDWAHIGQAVYEHGKDAAVAASDAWRKMYEGEANAR